MKNLILFIAIIILSSIGLFAQNLMLNPSFEQGVGNKVLNWRNNIPGSQTVIFKRENGFSRTGEYSVSVQKIDESAHAAWVQCLVLEKSKTYRLSVHGKTDDLDADFVMVVIFWKDGKPLQQPAAIKLSHANNADWRKLQLQFFHPNDIDSVDVLIELAAETGKVYFDDVELSEFAEPDSLYAFNCGANDILSNSPDQITYWPDRIYTAENGSGYIDQSSAPNTGMGRDIIGGGDGRDELYINGRYGFSEFRFDVENGFYAVNLHFCENEFHWKNKRIQNYQIEDKEVLKDFDVFKYGGRSYAVAHHFLTELKDGQLNIKAQATAGTTMLSGISLQKIVQDNIPPKTPQSATIINGFARNIVNWNASFEPDFKGFNIYRQTDESDFELVNTEPHPLSRYIDDNVTVGKTYNYKITALDLWGNESPATQVLSAAPVGDETSGLPIYELTVTEENLAKLNDNIFSDEYIAADFTYNGKVWPAVSIRYRGNVTQKLSKKNYKINFDNGEIFNGMKKLNLSAEMNDPSMMIDAITYSLRREAGVLTQNTYPVHLKLNGVFIGVYLQREQEDDYFIDNHDLPNSNIYRSQQGNFQILHDLAEYEKAYEKENNGSTGYDDLIELMELVNDPDIEYFKNNLPRAFDVGEFLTSYAILNCAADIDQHFHNFLLLRSFKDGNWRICNWDHNTTFRDSRTPINLYTEESPSSIGRQYNYLFNRMFHIDEFRYYYIKKIQEFVDGTFSKSNMRELLQNYHNTIKFDAERDIYKNGMEDNTVFMNNLPAKIDFVNIRVDYLKKVALKFLPTNYNPLYGIFINEIMADNNSSLSDENGKFVPWIEVYNDEIIPVDLSGSYLTNDINSPSLWKIPENTIIKPKSYLIIWADNDPSAGELHASFRLEKSGGEIAIFSPDNELLDSFTYGEQSEDVSYGRREDSKAELTFLDNPTPNAANTSEAFTSSVLINEFMASNNSIAPDETGNYTDWIELYNNSDINSDISGFYITDNFDTPMKWQVPDNTVIQPRGFLLIRADNDPEDGTCHATFKLSKDGEEIGLYAPDGTTIIDTISYGEQQTDISMGRNGDANPEWIFFSVSTPNASNKSTGISDSDIKFNLSQSYPNPFSQFTTINYELKESAHVTLNIFDIFGSKTATLIDARLSAGKHQAAFDGSGLAGGVYYYTLQVGGAVESGEVLLVR
ncbi:MAG: CotH kinase family protein [Candidatus Kapabacteria bacterium]|nr:CotH kinase family protein [Candidatus Kapabacteria bacterium]